MPGMLLISGLCFKVETDKCSQSGDDPRAGRALLGCGRGGGGGDRLGEE